MSNGATESGGRINAAALKRLLADQASAMGIPLTPLQLDQFSIYAAELVKWSQRINLTAILAPEEIVAKHFLDSLAPLDQFTEGQNVLDIGTGAGFPGLPLKLCRPTLSMTVIDGSRKKINFVSHLIRTLALPDINALQVRSENLRTDDKHRQAYDTVVSRAVCSLAELVVRAADFVKPDGRILAWKATRADEEIADLTRCSDNPAVAGGRRLKIHQKPYELPGFEQRRALVIVQLSEPNSGIENKVVREMHQKKR